MYILYVDESGVEDLRSGTTHFVLLGLVIPGDQWKRLDDILDRIKARYDLSGVEIHTGWMCRRYSEQESIIDFEKLDRTARRAAVEEAIRRRAGVLGVRGDRNKIKSYRRESQTIRPYIHLTREERLGCLEALAKELATWGTVRIFAEAISKPDFVPGSLTPYELAFEQVLTRYQAFLDGMRMRGIVVHDNNTTAAPRLTRLSRKFHRFGTFYRQIENIVETPLFVDSSLTSMIQMADLCAYALRRFIENNETLLWDVVESRVEQQNGVNVGLRHYTGKRPCMCRLCVAHGRR
ncbi:MAG: DUF3800 domain-containing protein [Acidobacteriia bacterium]|nr:DUF3800 domain-containing protein [Terriglobia bacterium]